jgi:hypothetical protein
MKKIFLLFIVLLMVGCGASDSNLDRSSAVPTTEVVEVATPNEGNGDVQTTAEAVVEAEAKPAETEARVEVVAEVSPEKEADIDQTPVPSPVTNPDRDHSDLLNDVLSSGGNGPAALREIRESGDPRFVAGLIDTLRYQRRLGEDIAFTLNALTDQQLQVDWFEWVEWAGKNPEIESFEGYVGWKANLFSQIDPNFLRFVNKDTKVASGSRVEEIVWGGVRVDGIPALDNPQMIDPAEADYLVPEERIFGVSFNGDTRAYPARFLDWHEMFNDIVGGEPVALAY